MTLKIKEEKIFSKGGAEANQFGLRIAHGDFFTTAFSSQGMKI